MKQIRFVLASKGVDKMEADLVQGPIGSVGKYDVEFKDGKLIASIDASPTAGVSAGVKVEVDAAVVLDALAKAIPGTIDDALLGIVKAALLNK
jgi:hypothetical protein